jgi:ADP-heptose:LPS heptosyltransferase
LLLLGERFPLCLFILNAPPSDFESLNYWAKNNPITKYLAIEAYTAKENFFELPGLMSLCSLVISVETAIMHLASSLNIQQIALIRQSAKHWRPLNNSQVLKGRQRVDSITPHEVFNATVRLQ